MERVVREHWRTAKLAVGPGDKEIGLLIAGLCPGPALRERSVQSFGEVEAGDLVRGQGGVEQAKLVDLAAEEAGGDAGRVGADGRVGEAAEADGISVGDG